MRTLHTYRPMVLKYEKVVFDYAVTYKTFAHWLVLPWSNGPDGKGGGR